jgi:hypothetical protein
MSAKSVQLAVEQLEQTIHLIRGHKMLLDRDLAALYGIPTKTFNRAVCRNIGRFPTDFIFELTREESERSRRPFRSLNAKARGTSIKHGTRSGDGFQCPQQPARHLGQHRDYARLRSISGNAFPLRHASLKRTTN